jgi:hypothetical protein
MLPRPLSPVMVAHRGPIITTIDSQAPSSSVMRRTKLSPNLRSASMKTRPSPKCVASLS